MIRRDARAVTVAESRLGKFEQPVNSPPTALSKNCPNPAITSYVRQQTDGADHFLYACAIKVGGLPKCRNATGICIQKYPLNATGVWQAHTPGTMPGQQMIASSKNTRKDMPYHDEYQ